MIESSPMDVKRLAIDTWNINNFAIMISQWRLY